MSKALLSAVVPHVRQYMSQYDGSHDYHHIERVVRLARHIAIRENERRAVAAEDAAAAAAAALTTRMDVDVVTICALMHDIGDRKYTDPAVDGPAETLIARTLEQLGADADMAQRCQTICRAVSWSGEVRDPQAVQAVLAAHPELAAVQDADRLDAIGSVGIARVFAFGGARRRPLDGSIQHIREKLVHIRGRLKTETGRQLAVERARRIELAYAWWHEEVDGLRGEATGDAEVEAILKL